MALSGSVFEIWHVTDRQTDIQTSAPFHDMATRSGPHNNVCLQSLFIFQVGSKLCVRVQVYVVSTYHAGRSFDSRPICDEARYWLGIAISACIPHLHSTPPLGGGSPRNIAMTFGVERIDWCGYLTVKKLKICSINSRTWRTDKRTDGRTDTTWRLHSIARQVWLCHKNLKSQRGCTTLRVVAVTRGWSKSFEITLLSKPCVSIFLQLYVSIL